MEARTRFWYECAAILYYEGRNFAFFASLAFTNIEITKVCRYFDWIFFIPLTFQFLDYQHTSVFGFSFFVLLMCDSIWILHYKLVIQQVVCKLKKLYYDTTLTLWNDGMKIAIFEKSM